MPRPLFRLPFFLPASIGVALAISLALPSSAGAQAIVTVPPADVQKTMDQIGDLDLLVALTPLKLTPPQIDTLLTLLKSIAREGEAKTKKDYELVRALAADVTKARTGMLAGKPLDTDLEARINKTNMEMEARYEAARADAAIRIAQTLKETLTPEQAALVAGQFAKINKGHLVLPASLRNSTPQKTKDYINGLALESFASRILLPERAIALLTALKTPPAESNTPPPVAAAPTAK